MLVRAWYASGPGLAFAMGTSTLIDQWRLDHGKDTLSGRAYTLISLAWWMFTLLVLMR